MAEETAERGENAYDWQSLMFLYNAAIKEVRTKLDIMNDEFQYIHQYNPIEYIKSRITKGRYGMKNRHPYTFYSKITAKYRKKQNRTNSFDQKRSSQNKLCQADNTTDFWC